MTTISAAGGKDHAGIRRYAWDLDGDGVLVEVAGGPAAAAIAQYAFQAAGQHHVRLRVHGGPFDFHDTLERTFTVIEAPGPLFPLTVRKAGSGAGVVATDPPGLIDCDETCASRGPLLLEPQSSITLAASAAAGSGFAGWSGIGCTGTAPTVLVSMAEARACTATFVSNQFTLAVTRTGDGVVASAPAGIACGADCIEAYEGGTTVVLTATPAAGFTVAGWSGCDTVNGDQCTVGVGAARAVEAAFTPTPGSFTLTVVVTGPADSLGRVTALQPPGAIDCGIPGGVCTVALPAGTPVQLRPDTASLENNQFAGWSGCDAVGTLFACSLTLTGDRTLAATFRP